MTIDTLLIPTDGSDPAEAAAARGFDLATQLEATVRVLSVADRSIAASASYTGDSRRIRSRLREQAAERADRLGATAERVGLAVTTDSREGIPATEIVDYAGEHDVDAIVMGTAGRGGVTRMVVGSVADKVVRTSPVPVVTVPPAASDAEPNGGSWTIDDLLLPTDGSQTADAAARDALEVASQLEATVHLLTVADTAQTSSVPTVTGVELLEGAAERLEELTAEAEARGLEVTTTVREGHPAEAILEHAETEPVDLIAMGTAGRGGVDRFVLGSVTDRVVRSAPVPVVTVRPDDVDPDG